MMQSEKTGVIGGAIGAIVGALSWLVILGIAIKSTVLVVGIVSAAAIGIFTAIKLYTVRPERKFAILGSVILWVTVINAIVGNIFYEKIPQTIWNIPTHQTQASLAQMNFFFAVFALFGFGYIIRDILNKGE